ncbi:MULTISPECIES: hypothetical protein [unclassified Crossiella]|uniref:hypothetical protein n=1 Tax=unclassified Crossiella TaxID=2620835 RepID=UPI001FFE7B61|nr:MULTISPECIES: hypothetical protein [unclassified Crossiella]MCK2241886.1 hypothetical protein [Crossiella sp. S99.2]MCK2255789.1 hypothetical protein [Crossiella sp. S99.1]
MKPGNPNRPQSRLAAVHPLHPQPNHPDERGEVIDLSELFGPDSFPEDVQIRLVAVLPSLPPDIRIQVGRAAYGISLAHKALMAIGDFYVQNPDGTDKP